MVGYVVIGQLEMESRDAEFFCFTILLIPSHSFLFVSICYLNLMVEPLPGPCVCWSFDALCCPFFMYFFFNLTENLWFYNKEEDVM